MPPTIGEFTWAVAKVFGTDPANIRGWLIVIHDQEHGMGFMTSAQSVERPGDREQARAILTQALRELDED